MIKIDESYPFGDLAKKKIEQCNEMNQVVNKTINRKKGIQQRTRWRMKLLLVSLYLVKTFDHYYFRPTVTVSVAVASSTIIVPFLFFFQMQFLPLQII